MTKKNLRAALALAFAVMSLGAYAQTSPIRPTYQYPTAPAQSGSQPAQSLGANRRRL